MAKGPIEDVDRILVLRRELRAEAGEHARRAARADVDRGRQAVLVVVRPLARSIAPAELASAHHVVHPRGPVPGSAEVPLHVGVVGKEVARRIEGQIVGIAVADADHLPVLSVRREAAHVAAGRHHPAGVPARIGLPRKEVILAPHLRHAVVIDLAGQLGVVAGNEVDPLAVGRRHERVRSVLAPAVCGHDELLVVQSPVSIGVGELVDPGVAAHAFVDRDPEGPLEPEQAVRSPDRHVDPFRAGGPVRTHRHVVELPILVGAHEASVVPHRHGHPAPFHLGNVVEFLELEALRHLVLVRCVPRFLRLTGDRRGGSEDLSPRIHSHLPVHRHPGPRRIIETRLLPVGGLRRGELPRPVCHDLDLLAVAVGDLQRGCHGRHSSLVRAEDCDGVASLVDVLADFEVLRALPPVPAPHFLAVDPRFVAVVGRDRQLRRLVRLRQLERLAEVDLLSIRPLAGRAPDPRGHRPPGLRGLPLRLGRRPLLRPGLRRHRAQGDLLDLELHRPARVQLQRQDSLQRSLRRVVVDDLGGRLAVHEVLHHVAAGRDRKFIELGEVQLRHGQLAGHLLLPVRGQLDLLPPQALDPPSPLFVEHREVLLLRMHVHLVAPHRPLGLVDDAGTVLDPRVVPAGHLGRHLEIEVLELSALPDEEGVRRDLLVRAVGLPHQHAVDHAPEPRIAVPTVEVFPVEEFLIPLTEGHRDKQHRGERGYEEPFHDAALRAANPGLSRSNPGNAANIVHNAVI